MPADTITDELLAEWVDGLHDLGIDEIAIGVKECQRLQRTAYCAEFVELCRPALAPIVPPAPLPQDLGGCSESREDSYTNCGLDQRWGPLP